MRLHSCAAASSKLDRHDGHHPEPDSAYAAYLRAHGYDCADPWSDYVISAVGADGEIVSGWNMRNARLPARVAEAHSETAYTTDRALEFIRARGDRARGCCTCRTSSRTGRTSRRRRITRATRSTNACR